MTIDKTEAAAALDDIERVVARVKQSRIYRTASTMMLLWGITVALGYVLSNSFPRSSAITWLVLQGVATIVTLVLSIGWDRGSRGAVEWRFGAFILLLFGFGLVWSLLLGHMGEREMDAFWCTLFMCCFTIAGLWFGRAFIVIGLAITLLTIAGYLWVGPLFKLYMAGVDGGGLILCGLLMRRA